MIFLDTSLLSIFIEAQYEKKMAVEFYGIHLAIRSSFLSSFSHHLL